MTRRSSVRRPRLLEAALVAVALTAGCGSGVELSLQIVPGQSAAGPTFDTRGVKFIHVTVTNFAKSDEETIPVDTSAQTPFQLKNVDRLRAVHVDVLGCEGSQCTQASDATFRGCTGPDVEVESDSSCLKGITNPCVVPAFVELQPFDCNVDLPGCTSAKNCTRALSR